MIDDQGYFLSSDKQFEVYVCERCGRTERYPIPRYWQPNLKCEHINEPGMLYVMKKIYPSEQGK